MQLRALALLISGALVACGSDSFTASESTDGGDEAASSGGDSGGSDSGAVGCLVVPSAVPANDVAFCNAFAHVYDECGSCETCRQSDVNNCVAYGDSFSEGFKSAIVSCQDSLTNCNALQSQTFGGSPCLDNAVRSATPSNAAMAVKNAYCTTCQPAVTGDAGVTAEHISCADFFKLPDGGSTAATGLLYVGDSIANDVKTNCTGLLTCGSGAFALCLGNQLCNGKHAVPKTTCAQGACK
ncbi:MAG: hypothetical protein ABI461_01665 [Polyangiaceae bacterium]